MFFKNAVILMFVKFLWLGLIFGVVRIVFKFISKIFRKNVFIVNIQILNQVFNNNQTLRQLDSKKIFECAKKMNKAVGVLSTDKIYKILSINNYYAALDIEAIFLKRK